MRGDLFLYVTRKLADIIYQWCFILGDDSKTDKFSVFTAVEGNKTRLEKVLKIHPIGKSFKKIMESDECLKIHESLIEQLMVPISGTDETPNKDTYLNAFLCSVQILCEKK